MSGGVAIYRPANGTEGAWFQERFCERCERDRAFRESADPGAEESCPILAATMIFRVSDPDYPREWRYGPDGRPLCTAFDDGQPPRCPATLDLFAAAPPL